MKPSPDGWPRMSSAVFYDDALAAIDFLRDAFGFQVDLVVEGDGGRVDFSRLTYGGGLVMVSSSGASEVKPDAGDRQSPRSCGGGNTQSIMVYVDDVDGHCSTAKAAGANVVDEPTTTDYGDGYWADRSYSVIDPEGHRWWFCQRMRG